MKRHAKASPAGSIKDQSRAKTLAVALTLIALSLLALAPSAGAVLTRARIASFGPDGTAGTSFPNSGLMFAANNRLYVLELTPSESTIYAFGLPSRTPVGGAFPLSVPSRGNALAVNQSGGPSDGNIYLGAFDSSLVYGFDETGAPLGGNFPFSNSSSADGAAVDSTGNIFVSSCDARTVKKYDPLGNPLGTLPGEFRHTIEPFPGSKVDGCPRGLAFDSADDLIVSERQGGLFKYTEASGYAGATQLAPGSFNFYVFDVTADRSTDRVYASFTGEDKVSVYDSPSGNLLYSFAEQSDGEYLAVDETTDQVYVTGFEPASSPDGRIDVYGPRENFADASATLNAATNVTTASADLSATITDNNTLPTNWRLEISGDDGVTWTKVSSGHTEGGESNVAVVGSASKLIANTTYKFRIVTNKSTAPSTEVPSAPLSFKTDPLPPTVTDVGAVGVSDTSARLVGTIDPRHSATSYVFEYGTTPALGSSTEPLAIGDGASPTTFSQVIGGLSPDTTYHFRVTATNEFGTTESDTATLHTRSDPLPDPSDRAWEQVTPVDKNYGDANAGFGFARAGSSLDGNAVGFCASNQFGDPPGQMTAVCAPYISRRGPGGWTTPNEMPPFCHTDPYTGNTDGLAGIYPSADFSRSVIMKPESPDCSIPPLDPDAPMRPNSISSNLYLQDRDANPFSYHLLNAATDLTPGVGDYTSQILVGGSDDFSHVVYQSKANQTPDSPPPAQFRKLYEWDNGTATLRLVSKDTSDQPFTAGSSAPVIHSISGGAVELASAVSDDGRRIYFVNPSSSLGSGSEACTKPGCELYMREDGADTYDVSATECTTSCGEPQEKADYFLSATPDGGKAFFASCAKLTDNSAPAGGCTSPWNGSIGGSSGDVGNGEDGKLYRWNRDGAPGNKLVDLTVDHEPSDGIQPTFLGLIGESDDGDTAYFATLGQVVAGAPTFPSSSGGTPIHPIVRGAKLYRWTWNNGSPSVQYIGPYQTTFGRWSPDMNTFQQHEHVSSNGKYMLIYTDLPYDKAADRDSDTDIYRWNEEQGWSCVSCQLPGTPSGGDVDLSEVWNEFVTAFFPETGTREPRIYMSEDGQRIFFGTPDALVPEDVNGEQGCPLDPFSDFLGVDLYRCEDVYEWHDGTVSLISSGTGEEPARLIGASTDGKNAFFYTRQRLVGWDVDDNVDIYDSRIGGGFPEPLPQPPSCEGEACRNAGTTAPPATGAGTAVFEGPGNPPAAKGCPKGKREVRRKGKSRCVAKKHHKRGSAKKQHRNAKNNRRAGR